MRYEGPGPCIVFSNSKIPDQSKMMTFLKKENAEKVDIVGDACDIVCVGNGELKRTSKLTLGVGLGKTIVTDQWVKDSFKAGYLVNPEGYMPSDSVQEGKWQVQLTEALERGRQGLRVFEDCVIHLTPALVDKGRGESTIRELEGMAFTMGAKKVAHHLPRAKKNKSPSSVSAVSRSASALAAVTGVTTTPSAVNSAGSTFVIGIENDPDGPTLAELGWTLYSQDIISLSILRGRLDLDTEEFRIDAVVESGSRMSTRKKGKTR